MSHINKKLPPYGRAADLEPEPSPDLQQQIIICCGSAGFERARSAQSSSWMLQVKHKLCLPFGSSANDYRWPVANRIVMIFEFGQPEAFELIRSLAINCLQYRAVKVLHLGTELTRFLPKVSGMESLNGGG